MPEKLLPLITTLKGLGFTQRNQIKLYGKIFQITSEPLVATGVVAFVKAIERKSGRLRYVRLPLPLSENCKRNTCDPVVP
jgi:hypothetical protein